MLGNNYDWAFGAPILQPSINKKLSRYVCDATVTETLDESPTDLLFTSPLPQLWSDYKYGPNVALTLPVICHVLVAA